MSSGVVSLLTVQRLTITAALAGILPPSISTSWAASVCYDEQFYPSIVRLEKTESGFQAFLGGKFFNAVHDRPTERPTIKFTDKSGWQPEQSFSCRDSSDCLPQKERGAHGIPPIALSKKKAVALDPRLQNAESIEQIVSDWTERDGFIWFGISFYSGEGVDGVGGIGRYDPRIPKMVIRRPKAILDSSINHIIHDGEWLWIGTIGHYECLGDPPTHGLLRYKWATGQIESFEGKEDGPCGFVVHDLLLDQHSLWVATDLGLSRYERRSKTWNHFIPNPIASLPMKPTSCTSIYTELLNTLPHEASPVFEFDNAHSQLFNTLNRFRPQFLAKYTQISGKAVTTLPSASSEKAPQ